jgi:hypothetical protein
MAVEHQEFKEATRRAHRSSHRRRRQSFAREIRDPFAQVRSRQLRDRLSGFARPTIQSRQVPAVTFEGVTRESLLDLKKGEMVLDEVALG